MVDPTLYSLDQLTAYENYISLPSRFHSSAASPTLSLEYLTALHVHQIGRVPYENLTLHYSSHHSVSLDPQVLFQKVVGDARGRGGYCMEGSIFFNTVLRSLGFAVELRGVRIRPRVGGVPGGKFTGWVHIVNIVTLPDGSQYMLDVAFGGDGPTLPLPLNSSPCPPIFTNLGPQQIRLIHSTTSPNLWESHKTKLSPQYTKPIPESDEKFWVYQYRNSEGMDWNTFYCFASQSQFYPPDFAVVNHYTSTAINDANFQTRTIIVVRFLISDDGGSDDVGKIVGKIMLINGVVKRNDGGRTQVVKVCKNEGERIDALVEWCDIKLTEEEVSGIGGSLGKVELVE
ncbi:arylamine N-acetyltransferase 1 [Amylocarpus encephaloides]|uniref:Arylamine N-acetyltransferase 1 n=1 Tax=Amylocarpus encephaloides TaxID=45428 RepID=A0A9P8C886_9HELO|nr:arylamine N-acetyltransferase 1 [Amylocarpus encephaloides]